MKYVFLALSLWLSTGVFACDCEFLGQINDEQYYSYELIVVGKVKKIKEGNEVDTVFLKVKQVYKGVPKNRMVAITTPSEARECGISPRRGEAWLIYARKYEGTYTTNQCTRSKSLTRKARFYYNSKGVQEGDIAFLEKKIQ